MNNARISPFGISFVWPPPVIPRALRIEFEGAIYHVENRGGHNGKRMKACRSQRQPWRAVMPLGWCLAVALSLLGSGCATGSRMPAYVTHPPPPSEEVRAGLGVITVVVTEPRATEIA